MSENIWKLKGAFVAECDMERMARLLNDLDEYGLEYHFNSNIAEWSHVKKKVVFNDEGYGVKEAQKEYYISIWGANVTKALKSPAFWNSIADKANGLIHRSILSTGLSTYGTGEAISRMMDQIALMWGHSFIERSGLLTAPIFQGKEIYTKYTFGLVENGVTHGNEPVIVMSNGSF